MMKIKPNLPEYKVKKAYISYILPNEIVKRLENQGVFGIKLNPSERMKSELRYHPDILTLNSPDNTWYCEDGYKSFAGQTMTKVMLGDAYPFDCTFNMMFVNDKVICGKKADIGFLEDKYEIVRVNQGYVKCSTVFVDESAYITSDYGIADKLKKLGCDVLTVSNEGILLNGFSCGFIGGCAGKISKNEIAFTGKLENHKNCADIKSFCANYGVDCISLGNDPLYDYGGILPIIE